MSLEENKEMKFYVEDVDVEDDVVDVEDDVVDVEDDDVEDDVVDVEDDDVEDDDVEDEDVEDDDVEYVDDDVEDEDVEYEGKKDQGLNYGEEEKKGELSDEEESELSDEEEDDEYLQKFDREVSHNFIEEFHPESKSHTDIEVKKLVKVSRNKEGIIVDDFHRTMPFLSKYEYTRVIGQRAKQIDSGAQPFVDLDNDVIDGYTIARKELDQKKIPFILQRPLPGGGCEYWKLEDLELLH